MKRNTWLALILLIAMVGVYYLAKYWSDIFPGDEMIETPVVSSYLYQEVDAVLTSVRIYDHDYNIFEMQRNQDGFWEITLPTPGVADITLASQAETQLNSLPITSRLGLVSSLADFGLRFPAYTIKVVFSNEIQYKIEVGDSAPVGTGYYAQLNDQEVFVVSQYTLDSILALISNPPYPATATPTSTVELPTFLPTESVTQTTPEAVQPTP